MHVRGKLAFKQFVNMYKFSYRPCPLSLDAGKIIRCIGPTVQYGTTLTSSRFFLNTLAFEFFISGERERERERERES